MGTSKITIRCANCNEILSEQERPCPSCGSEKRNYSVEIQNNVTISDGLKLEAKDQTGFVKVMSWVRSKISGKSKRRARESLTIDRTDPKFTRKIHHIEETTETGEHEVVHYEDEKFPAKRRPKR